MDRFPPFALVSWLDPRQFFSVFDAEGLIVKPRPVSLVALHIEEGIEIWRIPVQDSRAWWFGNRWNRSGGRKCCLRGLGSLQFTDVFAEPRVRQIDPDFPQAIQNFLERVAVGDQKLDLWPRLPDLASLGARCFARQLLEAPQVKFSRRFLPHTSSIAGCIQKVSTLYTKSIHFSRDSRCAAGEYTKNIQKVSNSGFGGLVKSSHQSGSGT